MENTLKYQSVLNRRLQFGWNFGAVLLLVILFFVGQALWQSKYAPNQIIVYAFSPEEEVFTEGIFPVFEQYWETETQRALTIEGVFGPSGALAGQIHLGAPADVAIFSNLNQVDWLRLGDLIGEDTQTVVLGTSPIVIVTRPGNPWNLQDLGDLSTPGLNLLHADPCSSGLAEWTLLAEYGEAWLATGDPQAAKAQIAAIWRNVRVMAPSARALFDLFELGAGDAFLTYEQDALLALERGVPLEIVIPSRTIIAQPVVVMVDSNVKRAEQAVVQAFIEFLVSEQGQQIFSQYHLRPIHGEQAKFPPIEKSFTVQDLGGWSQVYTNHVKLYWESEIYPTLELEALSAYICLER